MVWVVRTYKTKLDSGYGYTREPYDNSFDTKSEVIEYRSKLKVYSELFEIDYDIDKKRS